MTDGYIYIYILALIDVTRDPRAQSDHDLPKKIHSSVKTSSRSHRNKINIIVTHLYVH